MELYNFFTEVIPAKEKYKVADLTSAFTEINETFKGKGGCSLFSFEGLNGEQSFSIIGQVYGVDTNVGDTELLGILSGIEYTWFDAFNPRINNVSI